MAPSCYSQSLDSLPIKELNNEFLKGISAREKMHYLKNIAKLDSLQLSLYKDSIIPNYRRTIEKSKVEIIKLNYTIEEKNNLIQVYRYSVLALSFLCVGLLF